MTEELTAQQRLALEYIRPHKEAQKKAVDDALAGNPPRPRQRSKKYQHAELYDKNNKIYRLYDLYNDRKRVVRLPDNRVLFISDYDEAYDSFFDAQFKKLGKLLYGAMQIGGPYPSAEDLGTPQSEADKAALNSLADLIKVAADKTNPRAALESVKKVVESIESQGLSELDLENVILRPVFPIEVFEGCSIYEGFVKPILDAAPSKHAEFLVMPAMQLGLNYISGRIKDGFGSPKILNLFVGEISPRGQFHKSSSMDLALRYFNYCGCLAEYSRDIKNAEGRILYEFAGSSEGFGKDMQRVGARNAILFCDELGKLVAKAGVEHSSLGSDLLSWYEARHFSNSTKDTKSNFNFEAGKYTFGWLWATTDRGFNSHWPKLGGFLTDGLADRMFFVVSPKKEKPRGDWHDANTVAGSIQTKKNVDQAFSQCTWVIEDLKDYSRQIQGLDARSQDMIYKFGLWFAVDTGATTITSDHIAKALRLVEYRNQTFKFLAPIEAETREGRLQKEMVREIQQHGGKMKYRDLCLNLDYTRHGTGLWQQCYRGLLQEQILADFPEVIKTDKLGKRTSHMVGIRKQEE